MGIDTIVNSESTRAAGDDVPVVLLHGWGGNYRSTWQSTPMERELERAGRRILRIHLPGHGEGTFSHDPEAYNDLAEQTFEAFRGETVVDGVGYSLGGKVLLELASRYPERFRRLVIAAVGTNLLRPENGAFVGDALLAGPDEPLPPRLKKLIDVTRGAGNDLRAVAAVIRRSSTPPAREHLQCVRADVLLVAGTNDEIIGDPVELQAAIPHARLEQLDGIDHMDTPVSSAFQSATANFLLADRAERAL